MTPRNGGCAESPYPYRSIRRALRAARQIDGNAIRRAFGAFGAPAGVAP